MNEIDDMRQWKNVRLGDVARTASGGTPKRTVPAYYGGGIPWVKSGELGDSTVYQTQETISKEGLETSSAKIFPKGTLCIALYGATVGKLAILGIDAATNQAVCGIFLPDCIDTRFAYRFLESRRRELVELGKGGAQSNISQEIIRDLEFPIPPIEEQREIVAEIEKQFTRLEAGVANLRRVQANLKRYRAAVLKAACEGKLVLTEAELARQESRAMPAPRPGVFFVYAIRCDNDSIYIGQTQDLQKRWKEHLVGQAADWTGQHKPVLIVHYEEYSSREEAVAREKWLKTGFGRKWLRREIAAGRARQAGYETGTQLLERILAERRKKWSGKGKYGEPLMPDTRNLPELPEGWAWATFGQVSGLITKGSSPNWQGFHYCEDGIIFVRSENVRWGTLDLQGVAHLPPEFNDKERKSVLREGDILLNLVGASIGRAAIATAGVDGGNVNQAVAVIRLVEKKTTNQYAVLWLNSLEAQKRIHAEKVDVARANFSLEDTRVLPLPFPPRAEQKRIVAEVERRLSMVEELEAVVNASFRRAARLRQSILKSAFEGKLVVRHGAGVTSLAKDLSLAAEPSSMYGKYD